MTADPPGPPVKPAHEDPESAPDPAPVSKPAQVRPPRKQWVQPPAWAWALSAGLIVLGFMLFLTGTRMSKPNLLLSTESDFVELRVVETTRIDGLRISDVAVWGVDGQRQGGEGTEAAPEPLRLERANESPLAKENAVGDIAAELVVPKGSVVGIQRLGVGGEGARYSLRIAPEASDAFDIGHITLAIPGHYRVMQGDEILMETGDHGDGIEWAMTAKFGAVFTVSLGWAGRVSGTRINSLNFQVDRRENGVAGSIRSELKAARLHFLDVPSYQPVLIRGSDLEIRAPDLELHSLNLGREAIELTASGTAADVLTRVGEIVWSLSPTLFQRLRESDALRFVLGLLTISVGLIQAIVAGLQHMRGDNA